MSTLFRTGSNRNRLIKGFSGQIGPGTVYELRNSGVNKEIGRRSDVVGIFPNDAAAIRLCGALLIEQNDEWLVGRRYLSAESLALLLEEQGDEEPEEVSQLQAAT